ncbi:MAG: cytochrome ubiquinol oxidase subunit I [Wolbachia sp.]
MQLIVRWQTSIVFSVGEDRILYLTNWLEVIFNFSFLYRFIHMMIVAYLTTAFIIKKCWSIFIFGKDRMFLRQKLCLVWKLLL